MMLLFPQHIGVLNDPLNITIMSKIKYESESDILSKKKKQDKTIIQFIGESYESVTGSSTLVTYKDKTIMIDCGMYQGSSKFKSYIINKNMFKNISTKSVSDCILTHLNIDHTSQITTFFNQGGNPKVHMVKGSKRILELLLIDSFKINKSDVEYLNKGKKNYKLLFEEKDIKKVMSNSFEHKYSEIFNINEYMSVEFIPSGHIYLSAQVILRIKDGNYNRKLVFTGDLGGDIPKPMTKPIEYVKSCDLIVGECTYAMADNNCTKSNRESDKKLLYDTLNTTCGTNSSKVLIASFAQQRTLDILDVLYSIWEEKQFNYPIYVDSPLANSIIEIMASQTSDAIFHKLQLWANLRFIDSYEESRLLVESDEPCIIISSSGFGQGGRILTHFTTVLPDKKATLVTAGFSSIDSNMGQIKSRKPIQIMNDGKIKDYLSACNIVELKSFSSHMQHPQLLEYYSSINCEKVILNHGDNDRKQAFAELLEKEFEKLCKTTKVIIPNKKSRLEI